MTQTDKTTNPMVAGLSAAIGLADVWAAGPPFTRWLGGVLRAVEVGAIAMEFTVREEMTNPVGFLHGGVQCAIMDDAIGLAGATLGDEKFLLSVNLTVDYLSKAKVGERVIADARIVREGRKVVNAECRLTSSDGRLISRGTSNLLRSQVAAYAP
jgi:acyl-coenzyme A thioesterase 13